MENKNNAPLESAGYLYEFIETYTKTFKDGANPYRHLPSNPVMEFIFDYLEDNPFQVAQLYPDKDIYDLIAQLSYGGFLDNKMSIEEATIRIKSFVQSTATKEEQEDKDKQIEGMRKDTEMWMEREKMLIRRIEELEATKSAKVIRKQIKD